MTGSKKTGTESEKGEKFDDRIVIPMTKKMKKLFMGIVYIERETMANVVRKLVKNYVKRKDSKPQTAE